MFSQKIKSNCKNKLKNSVNKNSWEAARGLALILFYTLALISGPHIVIWITNFTSLTIILLKHNMF